MTGNISYFAELTKILMVVMSSIEIDEKGKITIEGTIENSSLRIDDVLYIEGLKHKLLGISYVIKVKKLFLNQIFVSFMISKPIKSYLLPRERKLRNGF